MPVVSKRPVGVEALRGVWDRPEGFQWPLLGHDLSMQNPISGSSLINLGISGGTPVEVAAPDPHSKHDTAKSQG